MSLSLARNFMLLWKNIDASVLHCVLHVAVKEYQCVGFELVYFYIYVDGGGGSARNA